MSRDPQHYLPSFFFRYDGGNSCGVAIVDGKWSDSSLLHFKGVWLANVEVCRIRHGLNSNLCGRLLGEAQSAALASAADSVHLDGLRATAVAGRAVAAGNPPGAAAVGAGDVLRSPQETNAFADGAITNSHGWCLHVARQLLRLLNTPSKNAATIDTIMQVITI
jgi:hypothetical protein